MEKATPEVYDKYIKGLMEISRAITSEQYIEDILKLIVMVTAKVTDVEICSLCRFAGAEGNEVQDAASGLRALADDEFFGRLPDVDRRQQQLRRRTLSVRHLQNAVL